MALTEAEYVQLNVKLSQHFFAAVDLSFLQVIHLFLPVLAKREPDTWPIIDRLRREYPHLKIAVPRVNPQTGELDHFYFESLAQLTISPWGIQEPHSGVPAVPEEIDLVVIPLLAFDEFGNRMGYGKGYYDRFLNQCRPDAKRVGLSLFPPFEKLPTEPHDMPLHLCITPTEVLSFA
jgi:5-formyltetrahydrofolate cyclo-ligase